MLEFFLVLSASLSLPEMLVVVADAKLVVEAASEEVVMVGTPSEVVVFETASEAYHSV